MAVVAMAVLLAVSFYVFTTNPLAIALLVLPMSLFQMSSASIDGISTALAIFSVSVFLRMAMDKRDAAPWLFYALAASVALLATSRIHLVSLLLLVLYICVQRKRPRFFLACGLVVAFVIGWTVVAMLHTVDTRVLLGATPSDIFVYYLKNPVAFFRILFETLTSAERLRFYVQSFFGILGWWMHFSMTGSIASSCISCFPSPCFRWPGPAPGLSGRPVLRSCAARCCRSCLCSSRFWSPGRRIPRA
jgi:uncharacterized membrane protein